MVKKRLLFIFLFVFAAVALMSGAPVGKDAIAFEIRWATAPVGGVWQALGTAMLDDVLKSNPKYKGSTLPLGGTANVVAVSKGKATCGFSFSSTAWEAWEGIEYFKKTGKLRNIRGLATLFPEPTQIAVWADSGITEVMQLKGKRITPGPKGSAIDGVTRQVLRAYGISYDDVKIRYMNFREAAQQMLDHHIDAIVYGAMAYPAPPIINISSQGKIRLIPLSQDIIDKLVKEYKAFEPYTLPPGSYPGVDYPVKGIAASVVVICNKDIPNDVAYNIAKSLAENFDNYTKVTKAIALGKREELGKPMGIPFHPGALKYYKERGWVK